MLTGLSSFREREKCMAHNLLSAVAENPGQENFVLFVGNEHLLPVTKQLADFMKEPQSFANYRRPPQFIEDQILFDDKEGKIKQELIKTFALAQSIFEQDFADLPLPFRHSEADLS